jgi:hypothetical protein
MVMSSCHWEKNASGETASGEKKDVMPIHSHLAVDYEYYVEWGAIKIPLEKYANPDVYKGYAEVDLEEFYTLLSEKMEVFHKDKAVESELIQIDRPPFVRSNTFLFNYPSFQKGFLNGQTIERLKAEVEKGNEIHFRLFLKSDSIHIHSTVIKIRDTQSPYKPPVQLPEFDHHGEEYGFQVVNQSGKRPLLRIDTLNRGTKHIMDMYRGNQLYGVVHIPGFRTRRRLITDKDELFDAKAIGRTELIRNEYSWYELPEFTAYAGENYRLEWGGLIADPYSNNFGLAIFWENAALPVKLFVGDRPFKVLSFNLFVCARRAKPLLFITDRTGASAVQEVLQKLPLESTVYFNRLIVAGQDGRPMVFPGSFAFSIAK